MSEEAKDILISLMKVVSSLQDSVLNVIQKQKVLEAELREIKNDLPK